MGESVPPDPLKGQSLDEGLVDRLVDGELSETQQREAIQQVQAHPDGWRRLALAFLEAQAWRQEMPHLVEKQIPHLVGKTSCSPPFERDGISKAEKQTSQLVGETFRAVEQPIIPTEQPSVRPVSLRRFSAPAWQILALAGGILLAFFGGYWVRDVRLGIQAGSQESSLVQGKTPPRGVPKGTGPSEEIWLKEPPGPSKREPSSGWEYVTLAAGTGPDGVPEVVRVPVSPATPENHFSPAAPPIPEEVLHLLRRCGAEVSHWRQFVPLRIEDGRQVVVPVEQVEIYHRPQGERYQ